MKSLLIFTFLLCFSPPGNALDLKFIPWDNTIAKGEFSIQSEKKEITIDYLHPAVRSAGYQVPHGSSSLALTAKGKLNPNGTPASVPLKIEKENQHPLVILIPDKKSPIGVRPIVLNDNPAHFKWGTYQVINTTNTDFILICDKRPTKIPGKWQPVFASPSGDSRNISIAFFLPERRDKPFYSSVWQHSKNLRQIVLIADSTNTNDGPASFKFILEDKRLLPK